jgi:hypothetical protein
MKAIDTSPLTAALDAREWRIVASYEDDVAAALETVVKLGATEDEIRRTLRQYVTDDNLIKRIIPAARHLRRQRQEAGQ